MSDNKNANAYRFRGRVAAVGKTERLGKDPSKPFLKRTVIIDDADPDAKYANPVPFEATGEDCGLFDQLRVGMLAEVAFYLKGREWKDKTGQTRYFAGNRVVSVKTLSDSSAADEAHADTPDPDAQDDSDDGVPF